LQSIFKQIKPNAKHIYETQQQIVIVDVIQTNRTAIYHNHLAPVMWI